MGDDFDVVVVGASLAGSTTALLLARRGLRVALVDRQRDLDAYKVCCTHFIQPSATPTLQRLGLDREIEALGGIRNHTAMYTPKGWITPEIDETYPHPPFGYSIRRKRLDPMVRRAAAATDGVELLLGHVAIGVVEDGDRVAGVTMRRRDGQTLDLRARLVVAADGRDTHMARFARVPGRVRAHGRIGYFIYAAGLRPHIGTLARIWAMDPNVAYALPCDDGLTLLGAIPVKSHLPEFKRDLSQAMLDYFRALPDGPPMDEIASISRPVGRIDAPNVRRPAAARGMAFVGDAALATDYIWGVGCGWAFQSAEWLADATTGALRRGADLGPALAGYRRRHRRELSTHHWAICDYATGRRFNPVERLLFRGASRDPALARSLHAYMSRTVPVRGFVNPANVARAAVVSFAPGRAAGPPPTEPQVVGSGDGGADRASRVSAAPARSASR